MTDTTRPNNCEEHEAVVKKFDKRRAEITAKYEARHAELIAARELERTHYPNIEAASVIESDYAWALADLKAQCVRDLQDCAQWEAQAHRDVDNPPAVDIDGVLLKDGDSHGHRRVN